MHNATLFEEGLDIIPDIVAGDANTDLTGDFINLENAGRAYYKLTKPAGSGGDDLSIHLQQATVAAGSDAKDLIFSKLWYKKAASSNDFSAVPLWTAVELATPTADLDLVSVNGVDLAMDTVGAMVIVEVRPESLDTNGGFKFVNCIIEGDDIGNALLINAEWMLKDCSYQQAIPPTALS